MLIPSMLITYILFEPHFLPLHYREMMKSNDNSLLRIHSIFYDKDRQNYLNYRDRHEMELKTSVLPLGGVKLFFYQRVHVTSRSAS